MTKIKILAVRHGESVANTQGIYQGQTYDTDLSELGKKQAEALAQYLSDIPLDHIITSRLKRTKQTGEAVARKKGLDIVHDDRIIETNHGLWEGKHKNWIGETYRDTYDQWFENPSKVTFPKGESFLNTWERVQDFLYTYPWQNTNLLVTHDNIIRIMLVVAEGKTLDSIWEYTLHPAAITEFELDGRNLQVLKINDDSFLGDLKADVGKHAL